MANPSKRIIIITGDKGGVGKSTFARGLLDIIWHKGIPCAAYDCDMRNPNLKRFYATVGKVVQLDLGAPGGLDQFLNALVEQPESLALLDFPAQSGDVWETLESELGFLAQLAARGYRITLVTVIGRSDDSLNAVRLGVQHCFDSGIVDFMVVKNLIFGRLDWFRRYDNSDVRVILQDVGGQELYLPELFEFTYDKLDQWDLPYRLAITDGRLQTADQSRVLQWLRKLEAQVEVPAVSALLGFPISVPIPESPPPALVEALSHDSLQLQEVSSNGHCE